MDEEPTEAPTAWREDPCMGKRPTGPPGRRGRDDPLPTGLSITIIFT